VLCEDLDLKTGKEATLSPYPLIKEGKVLLNEVSFRIGRSIEAIENVACFDVHCHTCTRIENVGLFQNIGIGKTEDQSVSILPSKKVVYRSSPVNTTFTSCSRQFTDIRLRIIIETTIIFISFTCITVSNISFGHVSN
jgi:hypothetical protein